ncbi:hypothetical protein L1887_62043 [Cichorium endivia]|nr:hypothetical protein L1887_62043 [Cichorium endivia]
MPGKGLQGPAWHEGSAPCCHPEHVCTAAAPVGGPLVAASKHGPALCVLCALRALFARDVAELGLVEGDAERLCAHARGALVLGLAGDRLARRALLDLVLARLDLAPGDDHVALVVEDARKVVPLLAHFAARAVLGVGLGEHVVVDLVEQRGDRAGQTLGRQRRLGLVVAAHRHDRLLLEILGSDLETHGHTAQLPVVELEARAVVVAQIRLGTDAGGLELLGGAVAGVHDGLLLLRRRLDTDTAGDDDHLHLRHAWRHHQTVVVAVHHDHDADGSRGETPRVLPHVQLALGLAAQLLGSLGVLDGDVEHLGEVLTEAVRSAALDTTAGGGDEALDGGGVVTAGELFLLRLDTGHDGDGEELLVHLAVEVEDVHDLLVGLLERDVGGVALLPEELARAEEGLRVLELPAHDAVPLVELERQVAVALDPLCVVGVHDGLGGGTDGDGTLEVAVAGLCDPSDLGGEALDVVLLALEHVCGDEHGEVAVLDADLLDLCVEEVLDGLPDKVGPGLEDVAARDVVVVEHVTLAQHLCVPLWEVASLADGDADLLCVGDLGGLCGLGLVGGGALGGGGGGGGAGGRGGGLCDRGGSLCLELGKVDDLELDAGALEVLCDLCAGHEEGLLGAGGVDGKVVGAGGEACVEHGDQVGSVVLGDGESRDVVLGGVEELLEHLGGGETHLLLADVLRDGAGVVFGVILCDEDDGGRGCGLGRLGLEDDGLGVVLGCEAERRGDLGHGGPPALWAVGGGVLDHLFGLDGERRERRRDGLHGECAQAERVMVYDQKGQWHIWHTTPVRLSRPHRCIFLRLELACRGKTECHFGRSSGSSDSCDWNLTTIALLSMTQQTRLARDIPKKKTLGSAATLPLPLALEKLWVWLHFFLAFLAAPS